MLKILSIFFLQNEYLSKWEVIQLRAHEMSYKKAYIELGVKPPSRSRLGEVNGLFTVDVSALRLFVVVAGGGGGGQWWASYAWELGGGVPRHSVEIHEWDTMGGGDSLSLCFPKKNHWPLGQGSNSASHSHTHNAIEAASRSEKQMPKYNWVTAWFLHPR